MMHRCTHGGNGRTRRRPGAAAAWLLAACGVALSPQAAAVNFSFTQGGFSQGGTVSGTFAGDDLDGNGQLSSFDGELTAFSMSFSGNATVPAFSLGLTNLSGLVYDLDGGPLGDGLAGDIEGIAASDGTFAYIAGPGPFNQCGISLDCAEVSALSAFDTSQQLIAVGAPGQGSPTDETAVPLLQQTAFIQPGIVSQRASGQILTTQMRARQGTIESGARAPASGNAVAGVPIVAEGLSAGDATASAYPVSAWFSFLRTEIENDGAATPFDSDVITALGGVDMLWNDYVFGVSLGYEAQTTTLGTRPGRQEGENFSLIPYMGYLVNDWMSVDFSAGYTRVDIEQSRVLGATTLQSNVDANRIFGAANLNLSHATGNWLLTGVAGGLYVRERQHDFAEIAAGVPGAVVNNPARTVRLGQLRVGGGASYFYQGWEPFVSAHYVYDFTRTRATVVPGQPAPSEDDDEVRLAAGLRYYDEANGLSAALDYTTVRGRQDIDSDSVSFTLRLDL